MRDSLSRSKGLLRPAPSEVDSSDALIGDINVTPFVDVMLVLLVIFMVTTPALLPMLKLDLPGPEQPTQVLEKPQAGDSEPLLFELDGQGGMRLDRKLVSSDDILVSKLSEAAQRDPEIELQLRVDASTAYERISRVFLMAQEQGIKRISLVMNQGPAAASTASRTKP